MSHKRKQQKVNKHVRRGIDSRRARADALERASAEEQQRAFEEWLPRIPPEWVKSQQQFREWRRMKETEFAMTIRASEFLRRTP